jgi:NAD(P)-dependent dehydrogenase (short-subunit alcohol dehydrogenase family)
MEMDGKTVLITGSTDGVGRYVAAKLAEAGAQLLIHGRDRRRAETLADEIRKAGHREPVFYPADLSSLAAVRHLAETVTAKHQRLDVFISNAGIGTHKPGPERCISQDGHELRFAVNYLSGFLLARMLLPLLKASAPSRIVNVSSIGQQAIDFGDVMLTKGYTGTRAYCQSKLAQVMFTIDLAEELGPVGVSANALHPATYMNTTMVRQGGMTPMSTVEEGGEAILRLVTDDNVGSGLFFNGKQPSRANAQAYDADARERLRRLSFELTGLPAA